MTFNLVTGPAEPVEIMTSGMPCSLTPAIYLKFMLCKGNES